MPFIKTMSKKKEEEKQKKAKKIGLRENEEKRPKKANVTAFTRGDEIENRFSYCVCVWV